MQENSFGFAHLWASGDGISHAVAIILAIMSISSWYLILAKCWDWWALRRAAGALAGFWSAASFAAGVDRLRQGGSASPYADIAVRASSCHEGCAAASTDLQSRFDPAAQIERALRQQLSGAQAGMENGLTLLATIGATSPFVGLLGTVWGIYHALLAIGLSGQAALEKVAGPVGEALIMTAAGLAVALPAVFAYNAFTRANRVAFANLEAFAHDLHAYFTSGRHFAERASRTPLAPVTCRAEAS